MASAKKPQARERQPAYGGLSSRVIKRLKMVRFIKIRIEFDPPQSTQKRDKYGRFARTNRLGMVKQGPYRQRDSRGRFINSSAFRPLHRDKRGRFTKATPQWHRRRSVMWAPVVLGLCGVLFFGWQIIKPPVIEAPVVTREVVPVISDVTVTLQESKPTRLRIAKIGVDASFVTIGKNADETIEVPSRADEVGWYNRGPTPGELGPAIVAGHVDWRGSLGVFYRLREMAPGDTFEIDRADGTTAKFKVIKVKQLPQDSFPTEEVYGSIDYAGVRLITCGGTFDRSIRRYSHNTVVYGQLIVDEQISANTGTN